MRIRLSVAVRIVNAFWLTLLIVASSPARATLCGGLLYPFPFTDIAAVGSAFCPGIMEAYVTGVTKGTTATTFSPNNNVDRTQMTTFLQRSLDQGLKRNTRRGALGQWWTPKTSDGLQKIDLPGAGPATFCKSDGDWIWVGNGNRIVSIDSSSGRLQTDVDSITFSTAGGILVANGKIYSTDPVTPVLLALKIPPPDDVSSISLLAYSVPFHPNNLAFDGDRVWTANFDDPTVSIIPVSNGNLLTAAAASVGGFTRPTDVLFDGANIWVTDSATGKLHKLNVSGGIVQTVVVGAKPGYMTYDGANIWVPNLDDNSITVVQASTGAVTATISADASNGLSVPLQAAFDGDRILITNPGNDSVTLFRSADLSLIGNVPLAPGAHPFGVCSDGINFWVTLRGSNQLLRL
jgi:S-layer family protein